MDPILLASKIACNIEDFQEQNDKLLLSQLSVPIPSDERDRLRLLRETNLLDSDESDPIFDRLTALAQRIFDVPFALVSLVDVDRQWFKSNMGLDNAYQTHRNDAFCAYTVVPTNPEVFVVKDAHLDPRFKDNALVTGPPHIRFYAGAALVLKKSRIGSLCVIDTKPHPEFSSENEKDLLDLGWMVSEHIRGIHESMLFQRNEEAMLIHRLTSELQMPMFKLRDEAKELAQIWDGVNSVAPSKNESHSIDIDNQEISEVKNSISSLNRSVLEFLQYLDLSARLDDLLTHIKQISKQLKSKSSKQIPSSKNSDNGDGLGSDNGLSSSNSMATIYMELEECNIVEVTNVVDQMLRVLYGCTNIDWHFDSTYACIYHKIHVSYPNIIMFLLLSTITRFKRSFESLSIRIGYQQLLSHATTSQDNEQSFDNEISVHSAAPTIKLDDDSTQEPEKLDDESSTVSTVLEGNLVIDIRIHTDTSTDAASRDLKLTESQKSELDKRFERIKHYFTTISHDITIDDILESINGNVSMSSIGVCDDIFCAIAQIVNESISKSRNEEEVQPSENKAIEFLIPCKAIPNAPFGSFENSRRLSSAELMDHSQQYQRIAATKAGAKRSLTILFICSNSPNESSLIDTRQWIDACHSRGDNVRIITDPKRGLSMIKALPFDVIFVDISLVGINYYYIQ